MIEAHEQKLLDDLYPQGLHKNKIYVGAQAFELITKHFGWHGNAFKQGEILYLKNEYVEPMSWVTLDPELGKRFEEIKFIQKCDEIKKSIETCTETEKQ